MWMVILLWVTMATPPWPSTAWGLWVGLDGAGTHAHRGVNTLRGTHTNRFSVNFLSISEVSFHTIKAHLLTMLCYVCCVSTDLHAEQNFCVAAILYHAFAALLQQERNKHCRALQRSDERGGCTFDPCSYLDMRTERAPTRPVHC